MGLHEIKQAIINKIEQYGKEREEHKKQKLSEGIDELHNLMESEATAQGTYDIDEEISAIKDAISEIKAERLSRQVEPIKKEVKRELGIIGGALKKGYHFAFPSPPQRTMTSEGVPIEKPRRESSLDILHARAESNREARAGQPRKPSGLDLLKAKASAKAGQPRRLSSLDVLKSKAGARAGQPRRPSSLEILQAKAGRTHAGKRHKSSLDIIREKAKQKRASPKARK